ncbi:MAG: flavin reductase family protein [Anaerolineales bacterium]|jgi:flavin reductase (DIM6/NTAB) family NADH-FMN oxidoreductase RutF
MSEKNIKTALNMMPYGFYSITSKADDDVNAMVANWITQCSFEPRQLALGLQRTSYTHGLVEKSRVFAVNIFREEDADYIKPFTKGRAKNPDKMADATFEAAPETGCPVLEGAAAVIECEVVEIIDAGGDHDIVVGELINAQVFKEGEVGETLTLPYLGWSYAG